MWLSWCCRGRQFGQCVALVWLLCWVELVPLVGLVGEHACAGGAWVAVVSFVLLRFLCAGVFGEGLRVLAGFLFFLLLFG